MDCRLSLEPQLSSNSPYQLPSNSVPVLRPAYEIAHKHNPIISTSLVSPYFVFKMPNFDSVNSLCSCLIAFEIRLSILDDMTFAQDDLVPPNSAQEVQVIPKDIVGGEDEIVTWKETLCSLVRSAGGPWYCNEASAS
jgi:hypothetical protein